MNIDEKPAGIREVYCEKCNYLLIRGLMYFAELVSVTCPQCGHKKVFEQTDTKHSGN